MMLTPEQLAELRRKYGPERRIYARKIVWLLDHIDAQQALIADLERDRDHWKANHENQVRRARILLERPDMPMERVKAYQRMQELEQDAERYRWLRDLPEGSEHEEIGNYPSYMWDEAIDAAMQK